MYLTPPTFYLVAAGFLLVVLVLAYFAGEQWMQAKRYRQMVMSGEATEDLHDLMDKIFAIIWDDPLSKVYVVQDYTNSDASLRFVSLGRVTSFNGSKGKFLIITRRGDGEFCAAIMENPQIAREYLEAKQKLRSAMREAWPYTPPERRDLEEHYDRHRKNLFLLKTK